MLNIYIDPGVKDVEIFKKAVVKGNDRYNVFSTLENIQLDKVDIAIIWLCAPD